MGYKRLLIVLFAALNATLAVAQPSTQTPVAAGLLVAARQDPLGFAMSLSDTGIPNGLELRGSANRPQLKPDFDLPKAPTVPLRQVVEEFNKSHADYRAVIMDGVVVVRPIGPKAPYLDSPSNEDLKTVNGLSKAASHIFSGLDPRLNAGGGVAGSFVNSSPDQRGEFSAVVLDGRGHSVVEVLNQLATQSGRGWVVETREDNGGARVRSFGLIHRQGAITRVGLE